MKDRISKFRCQRCGEERSHYCLGMCNRCYQRHLREKNKDRKIQSSGPYTYKRKKNNYPFSSPQLGENHQAILPETTKPTIIPSYTRVHNFNDQEGIERFLKFCKLIFSDYPAEGDIIKGACGIEERALNLLEKYGDINKAMYAVKNPVAIALNPDLIDNLPTEDIEKEVSQAWKELVKVKIDNKDEFLEKMKNSVETGITEQELQTLLQLATNMKVKVPKEITNQLTESENFSKSLRKRLVDKSLNIEELQDLVSKISEFKVKTSTMQQLQDLLSKAEDWINRYKRNTHPTLRQLQNLVTEGSSLPLSIPELLSLKDKHKNAKKWAESVHLLIKSWKCDKDVRTPVSEVQALINEAKALEINHHDISTLEEAVQKVFEWQERVKMTEEDIYCNEYIVKLLEEGQTLPLEVDSLEGMKNTFNWTTRAKKLLESKKINQKLLAQLANEGKNKNINNSMLKETQNLLNKSKQWREKAKKVLSANSDVKIETVQELVYEGENSNIDEEAYLNQLRLKLNKALEIQEQCKGSKDPGQSSLSNTNAKVPDKKRKPQPTTSDFDEIKTQLKSSENWLTASTSFIKKFPRSVPNIEETQILFKLIEECPSTSKNSHELLQLDNFKQALANWTKNVDYLLTIDDLQKIYEALNKAQEIPINVGLFEKLSEKAACIEWKHKVNHALKDNDVKKLTQLKIDLPSTVLKVSNEFTKLTAYLEKYENWANELEKVCEEGSVESLEDLYKASHEIIVPYEKKVLIKRSLISIYSWKERVRYFLESGGELTEGKALLKEGEYVCFDCEEQEQLTGLVDKLKNLRKRARRILSSLPNIFIRPPIQSRVFKKRHLLEDYSLESTGDTINDMISSIENAVETTAPMQPLCFPMYHPIEGLSIVITTPTFPKPLRLNDDKKKRPITYKQINEDVKNIKRPPRRPKNFEIHRQSYCICNNEVSWNDNIMINCDYCGEWYHPSCISIDAEDVDKIEEFSCFLCYERIGIRYDRIKRQVVGYGDFMGLVQECNGKFVCDETREILRISEKVAEWKNAAKELLEHGLMVKEVKKIYESDSVLIEEQQYLFDGKIMKILVDYEGLPVIIEERDNLLTLLRKRDWLREAYQSIYKKNSYRNIKKLLNERFAFDDEEFKEPITELQSMLTVIQEYSQELQEILKNTPTLALLKKFFENEEISHYKLDIFERNKRKLEQFESLLEEIKGEIKTKDKKKLAGLVAKAEKFGIKADVLNEASEYCS